MKKRILTAALALLLMFGVCSCGIKPELASPPPPTAEVSAEPLDNLGRWLERANERYNMSYDDFADYWCLMCDEYFGEDMLELLSLISSCENTAFDLGEENKQIADKRAEYKKLGGSDWRFEITNHSEQELDSTACANFSDELQHLSDLIRAVTVKAEAWSDSEWNDFAGSLGCDLDCAKAIIDDYRSIADNCAEVNVTAAKAIELTVSFSDGTELTDSTTLYEINGEYVSTELIDAASLLIQLIYF